MEFKTRNVKTLEEDVNKILYSGPQPVDKMRLSLS